MINSKWATVLAAPAGAVWALDTLVVNMPRVMEGGLLVAGIGAAILGWEGVRKLVHSATADKPAEAGSAEAVAQEAQEVAPEASFPAPMTVHQLPPAPTREDLLKAFQMGAQAATSQQRLER